MRRPSSVAGTPWIELLGPALLVVLVGIASGFVSAANDIYFLNALLAAAMVISIYVFVGNSGVLSFGHISFVAVGAFSAGVMTIPLESKTAVLPGLFPILRDHTIGNVPSLVLAAALGGVLAFLIGLPLMRLSGLAASIATFAVLQITYNVLSNWGSIGPGQTALSLVPESTHGVQAVIGVLIVIAIAFVYQQSRFGRLLRASREDAAAAEGVGVNVHRQRLWAFTLSGALAGFSGALYVHMLGSILASSVYLDLTFLTLAMLVVGGATSLWGATLGALLVSGLDSFLGQAEAGINVGFKLDIPEGSTLVVLGAAMAIVLILRPSGITGGREFAIPTLRHRSKTGATPPITEGTTE